MTFLDHSNVIRMHCVIENRINVRGHITSGSDETLTQLQGRAAATSARTNFYSGAAAIISLHLSICESLHKCNCAFAAFHL